MSMFLFRLGTAIARHRGLTVGVWLLVLFGLVGGSRAIGTDYDDTFVLPGASSQTGQDVLAQRFGLTGTNAQVLVTTGSGQITDKANADQVADVAKAVDDLDGVSASNPLSGSYPVVSGDKKSTIIQVRFVAQDPADGLLDRVAEAATPSAASGLTSSVGGDAYKADNEPSRVPELLGLLVSFLILATTFGSFVAAGMPILSSLVGVGITLSVVVFVTHATSVSSSAPTLAEMLGLAVGIDYALFILSRHRRNLGEGHSPAESMSRALATAGSAVVFAGTTVIIALTGLTVAGIPVLTVMGLAAAGAVAVAVVLALTLLPAIALLLGERLRPRSRKRTRKGVGFGTRWVRAATRVPLLTVAMVLFVLGLVAVPASRLELALPDNSTAPEGSQARETYDGITDAFGAGYNAPLSVTANIITSTDPQKTVADLADKVQQVPDVAAILQATPNPAADTGLVALVPKEGQTSLSTADLVRELRDRSGDWEKELGVSNVLVAGTTAVNIDVSERLAGALLPFAAIVIGLSVLLLMIVFRSIAVPIKATLGYLLSVGAALGAVVASFQWGWLGSVVGESSGPIVSFLPIFVMGVLFGLAMDYEMFLVSAMREDYVAHGDPEGAVLRGFKASSIVVTAAAAIMVSVFIAFIPGGSSTIKPIAFGLAIGVAVDAFVVRMTLVPAVLVMLGHRAWWLPAWLDRVLPEVDVEGEALHRKVAYEEWAATTGPTVLYTRDLVVRAGTPPLDVVAPPGVVTRVVVPDGLDERHLAHLLTGRAAAPAGEVVVDGMLLPEQRGQVHRVATVVDVAAVMSDEQLEAQVRADVRVHRSTRRGRRRAVDRVVARTADLEQSVGPASPHSMRPALVQAAEALEQQAALVVLVGLDGLLLAPDRHRATRLAHALAAQGIGVVVLEAPARGRGPVPEQAQQHPVEQAGDLTVEETRVSHD